MPILGAVDTVLEEGASGTSVKALQQALIAIGYGIGGAGADGVYGADTKAAVEAFQQASGLAVDGIAGPQTMTALARAASAARGAAQAVQSTAMVKAPAVKPAAAAAPGSGKKILLWGLLGVGLLFILKGLGAGSFGDPPAFKDFEDRSGLDPDDDDDVDDDVGEDDDETEDDDGEA